MIINKKQHNPLNFTSSNSQKTRQIVKTLKKQKTTDPTIQRKTSREVK